MPMNRRGIAVGAGVFLGALAFIGSGSLADVPDAAVAPTNSSTSTSTSTASRSSAVTAPSTTTTVAARTSTTIYERGALVIHGTGDVNFDPIYIPRLATEGHDSAFDGLGGLFVGDDLTIVNLECTPSLLGEPLDKEFAFRCDTSALPAMKRNGVDVVNLANNHSQDHGQVAMLDGMLQTSFAGLAPVGVGATVSSATQPAVFEVRGWRIAVLGMGGVVPGAGWLATEDRPGMASGDDIDQMTSAVASASQQADLVFVSIHWGVEGESEPPSDDVDRARAMIAAGADAIFGHHSHRLGGLESIDGRPVFWTLGNFIWPRLSDASATTGVARLEIAPDGEIVACLLPAFIERSGQPVLTGATDCSSQS